MKLMNKEDLIEKIKSLSKESRDLVIFCLKTYRDDFDGKTCTYSEKTGELTVLNKYKKEIFAIVLKNLD